MDTNSVEVENESNSLPENVVIYIYPKIKFIHPNQTTESFIWFNNLIKV